MTAASGHDPIKGDSAGKNYCCQICNTLRDKISLFWSWPQNRTPEQWIAIGTWALALITILVVVETMHASERQLRAYIGVTSRDVPNLVAKEKQNVGIFITNHGQTPALKLRCWGDVKIRENPLKGDLPLLEFRSDMLPINPGQKVPVVFQTNDVLSEEDKSAVESDHRRIFAYGMIEYFDVFEKRRTTIYRFEYGGARLISMHELAVSSEGNDEK